MDLTVDSVFTSALYSLHGSSIVTLSSSSGNVVQITAGCREGTGQHCRWKGDGLSLDLLTEQIV